MPGVLLLINEEAHVRELMRVAELLLGTSDLRPIVYVEDRMKHLKIVSQFAERGIEVLTSDSFPGVDSQETLKKPPGGRRLAWFLLLWARTMVRWLPDRIRRRICALDTADLEFIDLHCNVMRKRASVATRLFQQRVYAALVLPEDNVELDTAVWVSVARERGVKSIIVPYTISNTAEFIESYVRHAPYQVDASRQNKLTARCFPKWTQREKGHHFLRSTYAKIIAVELLGLAPPNPWLLNSGYADAIAVESAAMRDYYLAAGIPAHQLAMTGSLTDDVIVESSNNARTKRHALASELGLSAEQPLLLAALPPDQNTYDRPGCEFVNFDDLLKFWAETLAAVTGWAVLVRPHPKTRPERLDVLRRYGVAISYADTAELVPLCDAYVASASATIRWAIACGKPVVNFDVYRYGYRDYDGVEGVQLAVSRVEFSSLIGRLTSDQAYRAELEQQQKREASRWAMLDCGSARRLLALMGQSTAQQASHPSN